MSSSNVDREGVVCQLNQAPQSTTPHEENYAWYFTFGANMNENTLKSRGIAPSRSLVGTLPGYRMGFTYNGYDLVEPRFANIELFDENDDASAYVVEGVAHRILLRELRLLDTFEGAGTSYERFETIFQPAGTTATASVTTESTIVEPTKNIIRDITDIDVKSGNFLCYTYRAMPHLKTKEMDRTEGNGEVPSIRYLSLLVEGGRAAGLSPSYLEKLKASPCLKFEGTQIPPRLLARLAKGDCESFSLATVKQHDYNHRETLRKVSTPSELASASSYWITVAGWVFDVSSVVAHRAMLRKMSGIDGTFYCLTLWATAFGTGREVFMDPLGLVEVASLSLEQQEYVNAWLHHLEKNYPVVGTCTVMST